MIAVSVVAIGVLGVLATQVPLSRAKERPCGTTLRIDLGKADGLRAHANDVALTRLDGTLSPAEAERRAGQLWAQASEEEERCKDRQLVALLGLGAGGAAVISAVSLSTYHLGRRRGRIDEMRRTADGGRVTV